LPRVGGEPMVHHSPGVHARFARRRALVPL